MNISVEFVCHFDPLHVQGRDHNNSTTLRRPCISLAKVGSCCQSSRVASRLYFHSMLNTLISSCVRDTHGLDEFNTRLNLIAWF